MPGGVALHRYPLGRQRGFAKPAPAAQSYFVIKMLHSSKRSRLIETSIEECFVEESG